MYMRCGLCRDLCACGVPAPATAPDTTRTRVTERRESRRSCVSALSGLVDVLARTARRCRVLACVVTGDVTRGRGEDLEMCCLCKHDNDGHAIVGKETKSKIKKQKFLSFFYS